MGLLDGKTGLVTGGARGLGAEIARLAVAEGSNIVIGDIQEERGQALAADLHSAGVGAVFVRTDVSSAEDCKRLVETAVSRFGGLDWACNNAISGGREFNLLEAIPEADWTKTIDVCLKGVFLAMQAEIPAMLARGAGSIINITTSGMFRGEAMLAAYGAAKGGVDVLTRAGASEYSARGIRVNSVAPGGMESPAIERYFKQFPEIREKTIATHAMRRLGRPAEVAEPVIWLASDRASFVTGSCLVCDGGTQVSSHML